MDQGQALLDALGEWEGSEVTGVERRKGDPDEIQTVKAQLQVMMSCSR